MTTDVEARIAPNQLRLPARSSIASADAARARNTLVQLEDDWHEADPPGGRVLARLRRLVVGGAEDLNSRS